MDKLILVALLSVAFVGCSPEKGPDEVVQHPAKGVDAQWERLPPTSVIVSVNGSDYTKAQLLRSCALNDALMTVCFEALKLDPARQEKARDLADTNFRKQVLATFIIKEALLTASPVQEPSAEALKKTKGQLEKGATKGKWRYDQIAARVKQLGFADDLEALMRKEARVIDIVARAQATNRVYTLEEAAEERAKRLKVNAQLRDMNDKIYQNASNAVARVANGEDMAALAKEFFKTEQFGRVQNFNSVTEDDFSSEDEMREWRAMKDLPVGGVSGVTVLEDGIAIYRRLPDGETNEDGFRPRNYQKLVFRRMVLWEDMDAKSIQRQMNDRVQERSLNALYKRSVGQADIKFPSGENFVSPLTYNMLGPYRDLRKKTNGKPEK